MASRLVERIRQHRELRALLIVMLTSGSRPEDADRVSRLGIAAHLIKPVRQLKLLRCLDAVLGRTHQGAIRSAAAPPPVKRLPPLHVLVAEDGLVNQKLVRELLHKQGHRVTIVANGADAITAWQTGAPDIILMDVQMPGMDGLEATERIRSLESGTGRHVPIVAMTAHAMKGDRQRCLQAGMDEYVSKPLRLHQLLDAMAAALGMAALTEAATPTDAAQRPHRALEGVIDWQDALDAVNGDRSTPRFRRGSVLDGGAQTDAPAARFVGQR